MSEINAQTLEIAKETISYLKETSPLVFEAAQKQPLVASVKMLLLSLALLFVSVLFNQLRRKADCVEDCEFLITIAAIFAGASFILAVIGILDLIQYTLNPDYAALKYVRELICN